MVELWATMLPAAIAIALSPTGIIEMILVLLSARARLNAVVFLASVMVSVFLLPLLGASILRAWVKSSTGATGPSAANAGVLIGLAVLLILFAVGALMRPADTTPPAVFDKIAGMGRGAVFVLSLSVVWFNPINALILLSVGSRRPRSTCRLPPCCFRSSCSRCWPQPRSPPWWWCWSRAAWNVPARHLKGSGIGWSTTTGSSWLPSSVDSASCSSPRASPRSRDNLPGRPLIAPLYQVDLQSPRSVRALELPVKMGSNRSKIFVGSPPLDASDVVAPVFERERSGSRRGSPISVQRWQTHAVNSTRVDCDGPQRLPW